jgi:ankyrin repeat protein
MRLTLLCAAALFASPARAVSMSEAGVLVAAMRAQSSTASLLAAVRHGDVDQVRRLLGAGASADAAEEDGFSALMSAAAQGRADIVDALLEKHAAADAKQDDGRTALMYAARRGADDVVASLLKVEGLEINAISRDGNTALIEAARGRFGRIAGELIKRKAYPDVKNGEQFTALLLAARNQDWALAAALLDPAKGGSDPNLILSPQIGTTILMRAADEGDAKLAELLLDYGADPNQTDYAGTTALTRALSKNNAALASLLRARMTLTPLP